jgi:hypothetical protein
VSPVQLFFQLGDNNRFLLLLLRVLVLVLDRFFISFMEVSRRDDAIGRDDTRPSLSNFVGTTEQT